MGGRIVTKEEAGRVCSLVEHAPERTLSEWSDEEKALFVKATDNADFLGYSSDFMVFKALEPLNDAQIRFLLREIRTVFDGMWACVKQWHGEWSSVSAMSSEMSREELIIIRDKVFGGIDEWVEFIFTKKDLHTLVLSSDDALLPITFPEGSIVPLKYFTQTVRVWVDHKINPNLYDIVVKSARHHLCQAGPLAVGIVQGALFDCSGDRPPRHNIARAKLLKAIYEPEAGPVYQPTADAWMTLIFTEAHNVCNVDDNENESQEADDAEHGVYEMIFCDGCEHDSYDIGRACRCTHTRLHVDECRILMAMAVPIPCEFWDRLAYHNQWRLAHYVHTHKREFNLNIPISALHKAVEYDRVGFVKFLLQYGYFEATDVSPYANISTKMRECLGTGTRKRRRDALASAQSALDELKEDMPEGVYLKLCTRFQDAFNQ